MIYLIFLFIIEVWDFQLINGIYMRSFKLIKYSYKAKSNDNFVKHICSEEFSFFTTFVCILYVIFVWVNLYSKIVNYNFFFLVTNLPFINMKYSDLEIKIIS